MGVVAVCLEVFTTRMELEHVSEIAEAEKPITALRSRRLGRSSYWGKYSFRKLYCSTTTEVTEHCHMMLQADKRGVCTICRSLLCWKTQSCVWLLMLNEAKSAGLERKCNLGYESAVCGQSAMQHPQGFKHSTRTQETLLTVLKTSSRSY